MQCSVCRDIRMAMDEIGERAQLWFRERIRPGSALPSFTSPTNRKVAVKIHTVPPCSLRRRQRRQGTGLGYAIDPPFRKDVVVLAAELARSARAHDARIDLVD